MTRTAYLETTPTTQGWATEEIKECIARDEALLELIGTSGSPSVARMRSLVEHRLDELRARLRGLQFGHPSADDRREHVGSLPQSRRREFPPEQAGNRSRSLRPRP